LFLFDGSERAFTGENAIGNVTMGDFATSGNANPMELLREALTARARSVNRIPALPIGECR
jgi:hypothetical protein